MAVNAQRVIRMVCVPLRTHYYLSDHSSLLCTQQTHVLYIASTCVGNHVTQAGVDSEQWSEDGAFSPLDTSTGVGQWHV